MSRIGSAATRSAKGHPSAHSPRAGGPVASRYTAVEIGLAALVILTFSSRAQSQPPPQPGRFEASAGVQFVGGQSLGSGDAAETTPTGTSFRLFSTSTSLTSGARLDARLGARITRRVEVYASASYGAPRLRIAVSNDVENATPVTTAERVEEVTFTGGALWFLPTRASRVAPFVSADAGLLREIHEDGVLVQSGRVYQIGGGLKYLIRSRPRGRFRGFGARLDARALLRSKGIAFDAGVHATPAFGGSIYLRF